MRCNNNNTSLWIPFQFPISILYFPFYEKINIFSYFSTMKNFNLPDFQCFILEYKFYFKIFEILFWDDSITNHVKLTSLLNWKKNFKWELFSKIPTNRDALIKTFESVTLQKNFSKVTIEKIFQLQIHIPVPIFHPVNINPYKNH